MLFQLLKNYFDFFKEIDKIKNQINSIEKEINDKNFIINENKNIFIQKQNALNEIKLKIGKIIQISANKSKLTKKKIIFKIKILIIYKTPTLN